MPVKEKPSLSSFKLLFLASFDIRKEPVEMTAGVENAKIWVILEKDDISKMKVYFLKIVSEKYSYPRMLARKEVPAASSQRKGMRKNLFS